MNIMLITSLYFQRTNEEEIKVVNIILRNHEQCWKNITLPLYDNTFHDKLVSTKLQIVAFMFIALGYC